jgi:Flp pilus assembly protein TadG
MILAMRHSAARRRAVAAVEAAFALPILLIFLAAVIDLGRLGKMADCVSNAARNGAQYGSASSTAAANSTAIRAAAATEMSGLPNVSSTNPTLTTSVSGGVISVTVKYDTSSTSTILFPCSNITRTVQMPMMP